MWPTKCSHCQCGALTAYTQKQEGQIALPERCGQHAQTSPTDDYLDIPDDAECLEHTDEVPGQINLPPLKTVTRGVWESMVAAGQTDRMRCQQDIRQ